MGLKTIKEIAEEFGCSKQNISYHLKKLENFNPELRLTQLEGRQTLVTSEGIELLKLRINGKDNDKDLATNDKQKSTNIYHQINDKEKSHLSNETERINDNQKIIAEFYQNQLNKKDQEIEHLMQLLREEHQENEKYRHEIIELNLSYQEHTENLLEQFATTVNDQQKLFDDFFEKTTKLISDQGAQIAEITRTTQKLQQNQQELTLIEHQNSETPIEIEIKDPNKQDLISKRNNSILTNPLVYVKAFWDVIIKGD